MIRRGFDVNILSWIIWQFLFPFGFAMLIWPVQALILDKTHAYQRTFAEGDFLLFASFLLVGVFLHIDRARSLEKRLRKNGTVKVYQDLSLFFAFFFVAIYMTFKVYVLGDDRFDGAMIDGKMTGFSCFSVSSAALVAAWGAHSFSLLRNKMVKPDHGTNKNG